MSRNDVILGAVALVLVVFSLVVSLVIPRRDPGFPGRNLKAFVVVAVLLVVATLAAVELLGETHAAEEGERSEVVETGEGEAPEEGEAGIPAEADAEAGAGVYDAAGCGTCHIFAAAGSSGPLGPNLDESSVTYEAALQQITNGGGAMPAFSGQLSEEEIRDVAAFVVSARGS